ncbi:MAG: hypothetical protein Fur0025_32000 [Oscillatoriaceae cyanobacterium]
MAATTDVTQPVIDQSIIHKLQQLPAAQQQQILDYIEFLAQKYIPPQTKKPRVAGLHKGKVWIADDFNAPLPPEYWSGQG